jgi:hypothetical protein
VIISHVTSIRGPLPPFRCRQPIPHQGVAIASVAPNGDLLPWNPFDLAWPFAASAGSRSAPRRMRRYRGADLADLEAMPAVQADARRFVHEADLDAIATARIVAASKREGRR